MRTSLSLSIAVAVSAMPLAAQNLVPNGSFEDYTLCPDQVNQIERALGWFRPFNTSPDYFNECADVTSPIAIPLSALGYQNSVFGSGYVGIATYLAPGIIPVPKLGEEVIAIQLSEPLIIGTEVWISFWYAPGGDGNMPGGTGRLTVEGTGVRFSTTPSFDPFAGLANSAVLQMSSAPTDTLNWMEVCGTFIPDSAYEYLMIGNFVPDSLLSPQVLFPGGQNDFAYLFIDNVQVTHDPFLCAQGLNDSDGNLNEVSSWPNPVSDRLHIHRQASTSGHVHLELLDMGGTAVLQQLMQPWENRITLDVRHVTPGIYVLRSVLGRTTSYLTVVITPQ